MSRPVEHPRLGEGALGAAVGAGDVREAALGWAALLGLVGLLEVIGPEPVVTRLALGQRVDERVDVAGRHPDLRRQDDRRVEADDVVAALHHGPSTTGA